MEGTIPSSFRRVSFLKIEGKGNKLDDEGLFLQPFYIFGASSFCSLLWLQSPVIRYIAPKKTGAMPLLPGLGQGGE
jgi:hypothetical protein